MPIALIPALNPLLSFIASGEGGYNSMNQGTVGNRIVGSTHNAASKLGKNLTDMAIGEVMEHQAEGRLFAAGRYQVIPGTMRGILPATGLSRSDRFDAPNQDRFGIALIMQRKPVRDYLYGRSNDRTAALLALAQEWASLPDPRTGASFYGGANRSAHSVDEVARALDGARAALAGAGAGDSSSPAAGVASAGGGIGPLGIVVGLAAVYLIVRSMRR